MANISVGRKSGFILRSGVRRRETVWFTIPVVTATLAGSGSAALLGSLTASALAMRPFTVVRTRGILHVQSDQLAASEQYAASLGLCVVTDQASGVGITAVPTPENNRDSDVWFVYETIISAFSLITAAGVLTDGIMTQFDSKAMRKVEDGSDVVVVVENTTTFANGSIVTTGGRMLVKLH